MLTRWFHNLSPLAQGNIILLIGALLLLNAFHLVIGLNIIIILAAMCLIWIGFVQAGYLQWIKNHIHTIRSKK